MSKTKVSAELKCQICEDYLSGKYTIRELCHMYGIVYNEKCGRSSINDWVRIYNEVGIDGFKSSIGNSSYSKEFKLTVVEEYIAGSGSIRDFCMKYKIPSTHTLRQWIMCYNANRKFQDYDPKREVYMAEARRKTTIDERREIVRYCIEHNHDYKNTASIYDVSYSQVYSWVKKYETNGEEGLTDKRGHHKTDEDADELEKLRRENLRLKRQLEEKDMVVELLKKVKEFERM